MHIRLSGVSISSAIFPHEIPVFTVTVLKIIGDNGGYHFHIYFSIDAFISIPNHHVVIDISDICHYDYDEMRKRLSKYKRTRQWTDYDVESIIELIKLAQGDLIPTGNDVTIEN